MLLVVDDNPHFSALLKNLLEHRGFRLDIVDTGEEAISRVLHHGELYSLALIDLNLSGSSNINGLDVVTAIRAAGDIQKATLPIIIMTGMGIVDPASLAAGGIAAVIYKPFGLPELYAAVDAHLRVVPIADRDIVLGDGTS